MECLLDALQSNARKLTNSKGIPKRKRKAVIHHSVQYVDAPAPRYISIPHQFNYSSLELAIFSVDNSEQFYTPEVGTSSWESMLGTIICSPEEASLLEDCDVLAFEGCNREANVDFEIDVLREEFALERTLVCLSLQAFHHPQTVSQKHARSQLQGERARPLGSPVS